MLSNKSCGKEGGREGCLELWRLSSQVTVTCDGALLSWRWPNTCLSVGSSELIPYFALFVRAAFVLPIARDFSLLPFILSPPWHLRGSE